MNNLVEFLGLKWYDGLIHHEEHIGSDISLSALERSTDQVVKATYTTGTLLIIYSFLAHFVRADKLFLGAVMSFLSRIF